MITAARIESGRDLPKRLIAIGREIEAKTATINKSADAIQALLTEAASLCDRGGLAAFRRRHCPSLGQSRFYELLAVARGTKSAQQIRQMAKVRRVRHEAKNKAARRAAALPFRTEGSSQLHEVAPHLVPLAPSHGPRDGDRVRRITGHILELVLHMPAANPAAFADVPIELDDLHAVATFLRAIAEHKLSKTRLRVVR